MKNIFTIILYLLITTGLSAQNHQVITHVDTLQSGDVIITQTDVNGNVLDRGLLKSGYNFANDTTEIVFAPGSSTENSDDDFIGNISLPGSQSGFLPQDIVYNPHNSYYYIYGNRKVLVCDANMEMIKTFNISDVDFFSGFYSDYHHHRIVVHPTQNLVFVLSGDGALYSIDNYLNLDELDAAIDDVRMLRSSMKYYSTGNFLYYYLQYQDQFSTDYCKIYKYNTVSGTLQSSTLPGNIAYDIDVLNNPFGHKILLSTNQGIKVYTSSLVLETTFKPQNSFDHIEVMNNKIIAHETNPVNRLVVLNAVGIEEGDVTTANTHIRFALADASSNKLYLSFYTVTSSGIGKMEYTGSDWVFHDYEHNNVFGLAQNSTQILACGTDTVIFMHKQTGVQTSLASGMIGQMYRLAPCTSTNAALCTQPQNGNVLQVSATATEVLETGGHVLAVCRKGDKIYAAVNKFNNQGYILEMNASSGLVTSRIEPSFDFNPVDVFCLDEDIVGNNNVYVHYVIPDGETVIGKLMAFDCNDPSQISHAQQNFAGGLLEYLVSPNGSVFIGERGDECSTGCYIYFFNYDLSVKNSPYYAVGGCVKEFDYIDELNYFVFTSMCNNKIYFFNDSENGINIEGSCDVTHPYTFSYNVDEDLGYCSAGTTNAVSLHSIDMTDFSKTSVSSTYTLDFINELFYNPNDHYVYGISEEKLYKISNETVQNIVDLDETLDVNNDSYRDDDYTFDESNNILLVPYVTTERFDINRKILEVDLTDGINRVYDPRLSYQQQAVIIFPNKPVDLFGKSLVWYPEKENLFFGQSFFSVASLITTHSETRHLTGNWNWISFPCMPRLGNEGYGSKDLLENINPLSDLTLITFDGNNNLELTYNNLLWTTVEIPELVSTTGYKYYSNPTVEQTLPVNGVVLDPSTPIPLSSQHENWIGYFLEYPLYPEKAFAKVWDKLTRISTEHMTMVKVNGQWIYASRQVPINYGDAVIVTTSEDCELVWGWQLAPDEAYELPETQNYSYNQQAEYTPFYFEMDSLTDVNEIALTVNDSCVGAAVVEPGDSIVEVNAYLTGMPSGVPIEVETWSGFKSARLGSNTYSVVDVPTGKRLSRKIYTGEHQPYYLISFKAGEKTDQGEDFVLLQAPSPNPFSTATSLNFVLKRKSNISLTVHDLKGNMLRTVMDGVYPEGLYEAGWNGKDAGGKQAGNGIYIIRLTVNGKIVKNEKVVRIK